MCSSPHRISGDREAWYRLSVYLFSGRVIYIQVSVVAQFHKESNFGTWAWTIRTTLTIGLWQVPHESRFFWQKTRQSSIDSTCDCWGISINRNSCYVTCLPSQKYTSFLRLHEWLSKPSATSTTHYYYWAELSWAYIIPWKQRSGEYLEPQARPQLLLHNIFYLFMYQYRNYLLLIINSTFQLMNANVKPTAWDECEGQVRLRWSSNLSD